MSRLAPQSFVLATFTLILGACGATQTVAHVGTTQLTSASIATNQPSDQVLSVGPNLRAGCRVNDVTESPMFDFDSAQLSGNDRAIATRLAQCVTTGPLRGRFVSVVDCTDGKGRLGQERTTALREFLVTLGVDRLHITDTAAGADAHDDAPWQKARRIDIELAN